MKNLESTVTYSNIINSEIDSETFISIYRFWISMFYLDIEVASFFWLS